MFLENDVYIQQNIEIIPLKLLQKSVERRSNHMSKRLPKRIHTLGTYYVCIRHVICALNFILIVVF